MSGSSALAAADLDDGDDFLAAVEAIRVEALAGLAAPAQERLGQYFTPRQAAELIAAMPTLPVSTGTIRILDPGAGSGMLLAALVRQLVADSAARSLHVTAVEFDATVLPWLREAALRSERFAAANGRHLTVDVQHEDFIVSRTGLGSNATAAFDLVIMNPPYAKLGLNSGHRSALISHGVDCPNLYAAFLALGADALRDGGQLVAITPRSFANGPYFEQFRKYLLRTIAIDRVHTFESRSTVFSDTGVLQENIIVSGTKAGERSKVRFTISNGHLDQAMERVVPYEDLVQPDDPHQFLRMVVGESDAAVAMAMSAMPAAITDLPIQVSTGRVVDFRARENLRDEPDDGCVPLIYPGNLRNGVVEWPRKIRKAQGFSIRSDSDRKALLPSGCYVLVKRFSAKEEPRRIVAAVWDPRAHGDTPVAIENHLNVFHDGGRGLNRDVALGLSLWLNSTTVDQYFRTFSGHTQVNATDLRTLRYPSSDMLARLGRQAPRTLPQQAAVDHLVEAIVQPQDAT